MTRILQAGKPVATMPGAIALRPPDAGEGLLIQGAGLGSPLLAAYALLAVLDRSDSLLG